MTTIPSLEAVGKHTPGPWLAASRLLSIVGLPVVATANGRSIASVAFFALGEAFANHNRESAANAALIAAAPDLLEALRRSRKIHAYLAVPEDLTRTMARMLSEKAIEIIDAALLKAVGDSNLQDGE